MKTIAALLTLICVFTTSSAQTFTERLQKNAAGKGTIKVVHSAAIDKLVNGNQPDIKPAKPTTAKQNEKKVVETDKKNTTYVKQDNANSSARHDTPVARHDTPVAKHDTPTERQDTPVIDMRNKVMGRSYKVTGYRVQAYAGGNSRADREKARNIGDAIKMKFPEQPGYVHFYSPRWICRIGNFRTYEEAHAMLREIQKLGYKQASIVKGKISVQY